MTGLVLGAYAAARKDLASDDFAWSQWFARLRDEPLVGGLEIAWDRELFEGGAWRLAAELDPQWRSVVTMMAGVAARMGENPRYGLASDDEESRRAAVADVVAAHREIMELRRQFGPDAVAAIEIQSAPTATVAPASARAFTASLLEILELDWDGTAVVVEHCDGADGVHPQKAFLPLDVEIECVDAAADRTRSTRVGLAVNWARSVIERRGPEGADDAIRKLAERGRLAGLMFSGVSPVPTVFADAWRDSHLPVADGGDGSEPASLLTVERVGRALALAGGIPGFLGAKISAPKTPGVTLDERIAPSLATLRVIAAAAAR